MDKQIAMSKYELADKLAEIGFEMLGKDAKVMDIVKYAYLCSTKFDMADHGQVLIMNAIMDKLSKS